MADLLGTALHVDSSLLTFVLVAAHPGHIFLTWVMQQ